MSLFTDSWMLDIIAVVVAIITAFFFWIKSSYTFWSKRGILHPPPTFFLGNTKGAFTQTQTFSDLTMELYNYFRRNNKIHGGFYLLWMPMYVPVNPEIVKSIMQNDFNHFVDRGVYFNENSDPLSAHLFALEGAKWRNLRIKLSPTFTSGKMKMMFETLVKCGVQLKEEMDKRVEKGPINIKEILVRFTTDIIGSCAFGIESNSLQNPDNDFSKNGREFFEPNAWDNIVSMFTYIAPEIMRKFGTTAVRPAAVRNFFFNVITDTVEYREKNNIHRKDFMHLLLQLKNEGRLLDDDMQDSASNNSRFTMNELAAQAFVFFIAGFETSSTTMTFCLFELASNPEVQQKLRDEIVEVMAKHDNKLTYEAVMEMTYMDKVINETLRKYPPLPALNRICTKDYKIPGSDLVIEKGTKVLIPVIGLHHDEEFYPDPEKFDPERFTEENKRTRHQYTFIPFGEGPRICIGLRFGIMQTKVGLTTLLKNYRFSVNKKMKLPLKLDPKSFIMSTEGGIWLDYAKV